MHMRYNSPQRRCSQRVPCAENSLLLFRPARRARGFPHGVRIPPRRIFRVLFSVVFSSLTLKQVFEL